MTAAKASARKSLGEYKPLIVYPNGKTEVCEKSPERSPRYMRGEGMIAGNRYARGTTYKTRDEAVAVAQSWIDQRREDAERRYNEYKNDERQVVRRVAERCRLEAQTWGSKL